MEFGSLDWRCEVSGWAKIFWTEGEWIVWAAGLGLGGTIRLGLVEAEEVAGVGVWAEGINPSKKSHVVGDTG